jgi:dTDP-3,4-didehydro-2,6-dideoxy-alpha-D-glucose 3-reductase
MKRIRFGIIGCGGIARKAFLPALLQSQKASLVAFASRTKAKAQDFANEFGGEAIEGYVRLLNRDDIDALYIATPNAQLTIEAVKSGKHVLCEKPMACNVREAEEIFAHSAENDVAVLEGFVYQYHPQHQKLKELVKKGAIGEPRLFNAWFGFPPLAQSDIRYRPELCGGALLDAGVYTIHASRRFFGAEPGILSASLENAGQDVDIHGRALLTFPGERAASLAFSFDSYYRNMYTVWGSKGVISLQRAFSVPADFAPTLMLENSGGIKEIKVEPYNQFLGQLDYFCVNLSNAEACLRWKEDAINQARAVEALREVAKTPQESPI